MKSKGSMTNGSRSATGKSSKRSNVAQTPEPRLIKERQRQRRIRKLVRINWTPKPLRTKKRDQSYEDELRSLEIQKQKLALAKEEARVKRENEFIDQELKHKSCANRCGAI